MYCVVVLFLWLGKWLYECCLPVFVVPYMACICDTYTLHGCYVG